MDHMFSEVAASGAAQEENAQEENASPSVEILWAPSQNYGLCRCGEPLAPIGNQCLACFVKTEPKDTDEQMDREAVPADGPRGGAGNVEALHIEQMDREAVPAAQADKQNSSPDY